MGQQLYQINYKQLKKMENNNQRGHFNRHRQYLNEWLQNLYPTSTTTTCISSEYLSKHIYTQILQIEKQPPTHPKNKAKHPPSISGKSTKMQQGHDQKQGQVQVSIQQLWEKNQNFMQCLKDLCQDLLYYIYAGDNLRCMLPRCLIGYYELVKNIIIIDHNPTKPQPQHIPNQPHKQIPTQLQQYLKQKIIRIILMQSPYNYIRTNLTKLEELSPITQNFRAEISALLMGRFSYFCNLYSLALVHQGKTLPRVSEYFLGDLLDNLSEDSNIEVSIDLIMLSIIYSVYRINRYLILFSNIINIYQRQCEIKVDREKLLEFYNNQFIIKLLPNFLIENIKIVQIVKKEGDAGYGLDLPNREQDAMKNSGVGACINSFQYDQVKQQKSIYDMFQ